MENPSPSEQERNEKGCATLQSTAETCGAIITTSELADLVREDQDNHEMEFSCGEESDLSGLKRQCKKNPTHEGFVSIKDFGMRHLPEGYHDDTLVDFVRVHADLVVRVMVSYTSPARPTGYPCHRLRGKTVRRFGSGWVKSVYTYTPVDKETCPCSECAHSDTPRTEWGHVEVFTATHVVYDSQEAEHALCELDYNDEDDRLRGVVKPLVVWKVGRRTTETDRCHLSCVTHDLQLCERLHQLERRRAELQEQLRDFYWSPRDFHRLTIIVSHPHGCCKQVSVGEWTKRQEIHQQWTVFSYTTKTCPGCSGAPVYFLGMRLKRGLLHSGHPHSGHCQDTGLNQSGAGIF